ncbi:MAG: hypothetical protein KJ069_26920, partial [Anaerolineae bacterium]|nr:hypothetical protein [Anaerolineae bacterium]
MESNVTFTNNPAARLHEILTAAHGNTSDERSKMPARQIWTEVFSIDANDNRKLMMHMAALMDLTEKARSFVVTLQAKSVISMVSRFI